MGVSRKCVRTWIGRYAADGELGLHDRSGRLSPRRTGLHQTSGNASSNCARTPVKVRTG